MRFTRRQALAALAASAISSTTRAFGQSALPEIEKGPFDGTLEGLKAYQIPEWFKDAKFGMGVRHRSDDPGVFFFCGF